MSMQRDTSRDGFKNRLRLFLVSHFGWFWWLVARCGWTARIANSYLINTAVTVTRPRPHPWSTASDFTSWLSLTDKTWSGRHLPPVDQPADLPEVADVAALFARPAGAARVCPKSTTLFPAFAQYLTDGFLRTVASDRRKNTSNHEIDLSPLYGRTAAQTDALRLMSKSPDQYGRLKSQIIAGEEYPPFLLEDDGSAIKLEFKPLDPPLGLDLAAPGNKERSIFAVGGDRVNATPMVAMLNTVFLREHNRLAGLLAAANPGWGDERVFQTARNVVIVIFIKIVVEDYINHISSAHFRLRADPMSVWSRVWNRPNWITVEFNLLYRWHSLIPDAFRWADRDVPAGDMTMNNSLLLQVGVAAAIDVCSRQPATALGLFNTPAFLLEVEKVSLQQGRSNRLASYNDYRAAMSMPRVDRFEQITGDPARIDALRRLYGTPDRVEFFAGLFAEDVRPSTPMPPLIGRMVALDAFSQALTNPLLSEHVYNAATFSPLGLAQIEGTRSLRDVVERNSPGGLGDRVVSMTRLDWQRS